MGQLHDSLRMGTWRKPSYTTGIPLDLRIRWNTYSNRLWQFEDSTEHLASDQGVHEELGDAPDPPKGRTTMLQPPTGSKPVSHHANYNPNVPWVQWLRNNPCRGSHTLPAQHNSREIGSHKGSRADNRKIDLGGSPKFNNKNWQCILPIGCIQTEKLFYWCHSTRCQGLPGLRKERTHVSSVHCSKRKVRL